MTHWIPVARLWFVVATMVFVLSGCGGGGGGIGDDRRSLDGELTTNDFDEGRYFDVYEFTAESNGDATVEMQSDEVDSYLIAYRRDSPDSFTELTRDDDSGTGLDARVTFWITANDRYRIIATSFARDTGRYKLVFSRILGQPTLILRTTDAASVDAMTLPPVERKKDGKG